MQSEHKLSLPTLTAQQAEPMAAQRLDEAQSRLGFVPNMYAVMANSPGLLDTYIHGYERFRELSGLTPAEQEVVLLAISRENGCTYCVAAHSFLADQVSGVPTAVTDAIRDGGAIPGSPRCTSSPASWSRSAGCRAGPMSRRSSPPATASGRSSISSSPSR